MQIRDERCASAAPALSRFRPARLGLDGFRQERHERRSFLERRFQRLRDGTEDVFEDMAAIIVFRAIVPREGGAAERISKAHVTTNLMSPRWGKPSRCSTIPRR